MFASSLIKQDCYYLQRQDRKPATASYDLSQGIAQGATNCKKEGSHCVDVC